MKLDNWQYPGGFSVPVHGKVHIWRLSLELEPAVLSSLKKLLSDEEKQRAARFYFDMHRNHFIAARGQLRILLGKYLNIVPESLAFELNEFGKPYLSAEFPGLYFNISHSHEMALAGFSSDCEIGVDIEYRCPDWSGIHIAERFFSDEEVKSLKNLAEKYQHQAFFDCWSRKEAYIKARGTGLATPLAKFTVSLDPGRPAKLLSTSHEPLATKEWSLRSFIVDEHYSAAAVANAINWDIILYDGKNGRIIK